MRRVVGAAVIGNALEWYDFVIYSFLATTIASIFFPDSDEVAALLATFATFGVGFLARPFGAIVIGWIGDRYGRRVALVLTIMLMAAGTVLIGLVPAYASIGALAPTALVLARLIQGFAVGGEMGKCDRLHCRMGAGKPAGLLFELAAIEPGCRPSGRIRYHGSSQ